MVAWISHVVVFHGCCKLPQESAGLQIHSYLRHIILPISGTLPKENILYWIRNYQTQSFTVWEFRVLNSCHNSHKNTIKYSCLHVSHVGGGAGG
jgi:hypothetical protein